MQADAHQAVIERVGEMLSRPEPVSRNHNFAAFHGPRGRRALRLYRLLRGLGLDLDQAAEGGAMEVRAERANGDLRVVVSDPVRSYQRCSLVPGALAGHFLARLRAMGAWPPEEEAAS